MYVHAHARGYSNMHKNTQIFLLCVFLLFLHTQKQSNTDVQEHTHFSNRHFCFLSCIYKHTLLARFCFCFFTVFSACSLSFSLLSHTDTHTHTHKLFWHCHFGFTALEKTLRWREGAEIKRERGITQTFYSNLQHLYPIGCSTLRK